MMRVIDFHCDTMGERIARSEGKVGLRSNDCHISLEKMLKGEGLAQFFAIWIPLHDTAEKLGVTMQPYEYFNFVYGKYLEEMEKNKDIVAPAFCLDDIKANREKGLLSSILSIEDSVPLEGKTERVVAVNNNQLMDYDIDEALAMKKPFKDQLFRMAEEINI